MVQTKVHDNFLKEWQEKFREKSSKALWKQFRENLWKKFQDKLETFKKLLKLLGETLLEISGITPGEILKKKQSCENIWEKSKTRKNFWKYVKSNFGRSFTTPATTSKAILGVFFLTGGTQGKISLMPLIMESWKKIQQDHCEKPLATKVGIWESWRILIEKFRKELLESCKNAFKNPEEPP